ncbi:MAG: cobyrinate a,c-diamide synthase [Magnetococcus sp. WYHC-3]
MMGTSLNLPRLLLAAPRKSSGKTTLSLGLVRLMVRRGLTVQTFKKGPDYIDPRWLTQAARPRDGSPGRPCRSLDPHLMGMSACGQRLARWGQGADVALVEANMGVFDGQDPEGGDCAARMARDLGMPLILVVDCQGMGRSVAALVGGFLSFPDGQAIAGLLLNNVASPRHENRMRSTLERYASVPVLGAVPRFSALGIEERHLGLEPVDEHAGAEDLIDSLADRLADLLDVDALLALARQAPPLPGVESLPASVAAPCCRVGYAVDRAFHFYYPENLEALEAAGVALVPLDLMGGGPFPDVAGLYIGGGFPEMFLDALGPEHAALAWVRQRVAAGMPVYAECGGLMFLSQGIRWGGRSAAMAGVLPFGVEMTPRPQGYGYMEMTSTGALPWAAAGELRRCHEFHYSRPLDLPDGLTYAWRVRRGSGLGNGHDGVVVGSVYAGYAHWHAEVTQEWAPLWADFWRRGRFGS